MPLDIGLASLASQGLNAVTGIFQSNYEKGWDLAMHKMQRAENLKDWNMQNEYNSPAAQMARYKAAGLNPNLIYGQSQQGATVKSAEIPRSQGRPVSFDFQGPLMAHQDLAVKQAQVDNLKAQNDVYVQDALLRSAQVLQTISSTDRTNIDRQAAEFDLKLKSDLRNTSVEAANAALEKVKADTQYTLNQDERAKALQSATLAEAAERILKSRAERSVIPSQKSEIEQRIELLKKDNLLKQLDIDLKKLGIQPGDPLWQRVIGRIVNSEDTKSTIQKLKDNPGGLLQGLSDSILGGNVDSSGNVNPGAINRWLQKFR